MTTTNQGLLFVLGECGPDVSDKEFNDWYDTEHVPARLATPGFINAARYKQTDASQGPSYLALYDLTSPEVMQSQAYKSLASKASQNEKHVIANLAMLNRRVYSHFLTFEKPSAGPANGDAEPAPFVLVAELPTTPKTEEEVNSWYMEEHLAELSNVPGFLRARRFKLVDFVELAGKRDDDLVAANEPSQYATVYEWDSETVIGSKEFKHALETPWSIRIIDPIKDRLSLKFFRLQSKF